MTAEAALESEDLMSLIAEYLDPTSIVALGRVCRNVRTALRRARRHLRRARPTGEGGV